MNRKLYILGAGGLGKEFGAYIKYINSDFLLKGFFDDNRRDSVGEIGEVLGPLSKVQDLERESNLLIAIGDPSVKESIYTQISNNENFKFPAFIQKGVKVFDNQTLRYGRGCMVSTGSSLTVDITLGTFVLINLNCTIGHDVEIGDFSSIMPGVNISGNVKIGKGVLIGSGATILQNIIIGDNAVIGAGSVVTHDVPAGKTVKGIPAS